MVPVLLTENEQEKLDFCGDFRKYPLVYLLSFLPVIW